MGTDGDPEIGDFDGAEGGDEVVEEVARVNDA